MKPGFWSSEAQNVAYSDYNAVSEQRPQKFGVDFKDSYFVSRMYFNFFKQFCFPAPSLTTRGISMEGLML